MARKSEITLKHYIHKEAGSLWEQGQALVKHYIPNYTLELTLFGTYSWTVPAIELIVWCIGGAALTTLLHEIAHAKLHKRCFEFTLNPWRDERDEHEAWVWAEGTCKRLGIEFDYEYAEYAIAIYRKRFKFRHAVLPNWRYYDEHRRAEARKRLVHKVR